MYVGSRACDLNCLPTFIAGNLKWIVVHEVVRDFVDKRALTGFDGDAAWIDA
jgi:hypothetical protein